MRKTGDYDRYRIIHKPTGLEKFFRIKGSGDGSYESEYLYIASKLSKALMRDILCLKYGPKNWRRLENKHVNQLRKSIIRAIKFAK